MKKPKVYKTTGWQDHVCLNCGSGKYKPHLVHVFDGEDILYTACQDCGISTEICKLTDILSEYVFKE